MRPPSASKPPLPHKPPLPKVKTPKPKRIGELLAEKGFSIYASRDREQIKIERKTTDLVKKYWEQYMLEKKSTT